MHVVDHVTGEPVAGGSRNVLREAARIAREILAANGIVDEYHVMRHLCNLESTYTLETARGCPYRCYFCSVWKFYQGKCRTKSPERVVAELAELVPGPYSVMVIDPRLADIGLELATGEIIVIFDADYLPPVGIVRDIAISFKNPEIGAVMGRVIPENAQKNLLTRLLYLERSAGYQVDQQARQNMGLVPQYGGTVGGFRKSVVVTLGGFNPNILTEDTELTFRLLINGWKVMYNNRIECYEEVPEDWDVRARQLTRWARGHTQVMFQCLIPFLRSPYLPLKTKIDGALLMCIYIVPIILTFGIIVALLLFFLNEMQLFESMFVFIAVTGFNIFGNFAPFFQIGAASVLDGFTYRVRLLPMIMFSFLFNLFYSAYGSYQAVLDQASDLLVR